MSTQACPHCRTSHLIWFKSLPAWITAVDALGVPYDSQLAHEMMNAESSVYWLCTSCGQGGMAVGAARGLIYADKAGQATMITTTVTVRGAKHLLAAHTASYARDSCPEYRKAFDMVSPDVAAMRQAAGQDKEGGDDDVFRDLAERATENWRATNRMTLSQASIGDLPGALRVAVCFTHAFADVLWDELGESADEDCGADDQTRLDILVGMWMELGGVRSNKPVSRKAKQKAEAKLRATANRKGR